MNSIKSMIKCIKFETVMITFTLATILMAIVHMGLSVAEFNEDRALIKQVQALELQHGK